MATSEFILQGFTASSHVDVLQRLFDLPDIQSVLISVAYVTDGGVGMIAEPLMPHGARATVFAGIRNDTTSYQGLARLHGIVGQLYAVDTRSQTVIFHPKLYLVRGTERARLVIGSANLTIAGLHGNIEAGMLLDFDLADTADKALIENIENLFAASVTDYPDHVVKVDDVAELDEFLVAGRLVDELKNVPDEDDFGRAIDGGITEIDSENAGVLRIKLKVQPLQGGIVKAKAVSKELDGRKIPQATPEPTIRSIPASSVELEPQESATPLVDYFPVNRGNRKGSRLRSARAKREAKRLGKKWFYTGDPCKFGHDSDRLVSNGKCRECNRQDSEHSNRLGLYR